MRLTYARLFPFLTSFTSPPASSPPSRSLSHIMSGKVFKASVVVRIEPPPRLSSAPCHAAILTIGFGPLPSQDILIGAGKAAPTPPIGPALGARGVKSMDFCKEFNARTATLIPGLPLRTKISIAADRSFTFKTSTPTVSWFLMKAAGIEKGSETAGQRGSKPVGKVGLKTVYEIAKVKSQDEGAKGKPLYGIAASVVSTAKSMGIEIVY